MRILACGLFGMALAVALASVEGGEQKDKAEKPKVGALAPHPLDGAFEKGKKETDLTNGLLNNKLFQTAIAEALKAKVKQEAAIAQNPKLLSSTPAQAARVRFLEVLKNEMKADE